MLNLGFLGNTHGKFMGKFDRSCYEFSSKYGLNNEPETVRGKAELAKLMIINIRQGIWQMQIEVILDRFDLSNQF